MVKLNISINKNKLLGPVQTALFQAKKIPAKTHRDQLQTI